MSSRGAENTGGAFFFRDCRIVQRTPRGAVFISALWHLVAVLALIELLPLIPVPVRVAPVQEQITWYGPAGTLPLIAPALPRKPRVRREAPAPKPVALPDRGAEAFHPNLTILNEPAKPNHPRQTLIQPAAPPEPPKILPALPNIVAWEAPGPAAPPIDTRLAAPRARRDAAAAQPLAAPALPENDRQIALAAIAPEIELQKPLIAVNPIAAPRARTVRQADASAAPEIGGGGTNGSEDHRLIALSASPAPVPPPAAPLGNLESRLSIGPNGGKPGASGDSSGKGTGAASGSGPAGLTISSNSPLRADLGSPGRSRPAILAQPGVAAAATKPMDVPSRTEPGSFAAKLKAGASPEGLLQGSGSHTLVMAMPNLTSATGSWILSFAELDPDGHAPGDLSSPEPLHKVDPQYPPFLRNQKVEGDVVLYAVIRRDGSVDSIQLLAGIDPALDSNAMKALAQWKFRPAVRHGAAVELEAIVHIPLHATAPLN